MAYNHSTGKTELEGASASWTTQQGSTGNKVWFYLNKQTHKPHFQHTVNSVSLDTSLTQMKFGMSCSSQKLHVIIIGYITKIPYFTTMLSFDVVLNLF